MSIHERAAERLRYLAEDAESSIVPRGFAGGQAMGYRHALEIIEEEVRFSKALKNLSKALKKRTKR